MNARIVWPLAAALGIAGLLLFWTQSTAQRVGRGEPPARPAADGPPPPHFGGPPGRFVVAHATVTQIIILDTATGQVYRAKDEDFKKLSDLPHSGPGGRDMRRDERRPAPKDGEERPRRRPGAEEKKDDAPRRNPRDEKQPD